MRSTVPAIYDVSQKHVAADAAAAYAFWRAKEYDDSVRQPRGSDLQRSSFSSVCVDACACVLTFEVPCHASSDDGDGVFFHHS